MSLSLDQAMHELKSMLPEYVEEFRALKQSGDNRRLNCVNPAHEDKNPSCFLLAPTIKDGLTFDDWKFYCHSCGVTGDIFNAAALLEEKPIAGHEFIEDNVLYLAEKMKIGDVRTRQLSEREKLEASMHQCMKAAVDVLKDITPQGRNDMDWHVRKYIYDHGWVIDDETEKEFGFGQNPGTLISMGVFWIPSGELFRERMTALGYNQQFLDRMDMWKRGRDQHPIFNAKTLIFTIYDSKGRPVGFAGRDCTWKEGGEGSKYTNTSSSLEGSIYHKGKLLYNMHVAKRQKKAVYVFEGYSDVITARMSGFDRCVAVCSSNLTSDQMLALSANSISEMILVMDGDEAGRQAINKILDERISGQSDVRCKILLLDEMDPDEFFRAHGIEEFFKLRAIDPFEYRLDLIQKEAMDTEEVCNLMIPLIVNEPSSIAQEKMAKILAEYTGFSLQAILQDLNKASNYRNAEREQAKKALLHEAVLKTEENWDVAPLILMDVANRIAQIDSVAKSDSMSHVEFARAIVEQKEMEEERGDEKPGFRLGPMLEILDDRLAGEWPGSLGIIGGRANTGKTTLLTQMALAAALENEDVVSIILTLDDARRKIVPRLVSLLAHEEYNNIFLNMGMIERPAHWATKLNTNAVYEYRDAGYRRLRETVNDGRIIVKDTTHGTSFPYVQALLKHTQHAYPEKQVMFWLDSYHKVSTTDGSRDREFHVELALLIKNLAKQLSIPFWMNAEYHKIQPGTRPNNNHLAETVKLEYEADVIIHLYNDLHDIGFESDMYFTFDNERQPLVEGIFGKNKLNDFKDRIWMKFYPAHGMHQAIDREQAEAIVRTQEPVALEDDDD